MKLILQGDLKALLKWPLRGQDIIKHDLCRRTSIKDVIESFGLPHTEVAKLTIDDREISFSHIITNSDTVNISPYTAPVDALSPSLLRPQPLSKITFAIDVNVGKLAPLLRMAGFDTYYKNYISDSELAELACQQSRIILSKDKNLLKRKNVTFGRLVREIIPEKQLIEVINLFGLKEKTQPFTRCLKCNDLLHPVEKQKIIERLEPLTRKYYNSFHQCDQCDKIYWPGSHRQKMLALLQRCCDLQG